MSKMVHWLKSIDDYEGVFWIHWCLSLAYVIVSFGNLSEALQFGILLATLPTWVYLAFKGKSHGNRKNTDRL